MRKITSDGVVTTLAGYTHSPGSQDGFGSAARFNWPQGIAVDSTATFTLGDTNNSTIRKITPDGMVSTVAGLGGNGGNVDGIGAAARFNHPKGVALDAANNIFVADTYNGSIRKITPDGSVATFAGRVPSTSPFGSPLGVAVDTGGYLYVADGSRILKITPDGVVSALAGSQSYSGSNDGPASAARFGGPHGIAVDKAGNVYVADTSDFKIRKITPDGNVTTLGGYQMGNVAGAGRAARFDQPMGIAVDSSGKVYVADYYNHTIRVGVPAPAPSQLGNISTRVGVKTGDNALIAGFIVTGTKRKTVMLRAVGPSLKQANIAGPLADPTLELYDSGGALIARNDNWWQTDIGGILQSPQDVDLYSSGLAPTDYMESAILVELVPGAYTAIVRGKDNTTGIAVVESYDFDWSQESNLANISTRGLVQTGEGVMIGGMIVRGSTRRMSLFVRLAQLWQISPCPTLCRILSRAA